MLDISNLTEIRPHLVQSLTSTIRTFLCKSEKNKKIYYDEFIKENMEIEDVTDDEHFRFLNMWLCKFVIFNGSSRVTMEYRTKIFLIIPTLYCDP